MRLERAMNLLGACFAAGMAVPVATAILAIPVVLTAYGVGCAWLWGAEQAAGRARWPAEPAVEEARRGRLSQLAGRARQQGHLPRPGDCPICFSEPASFQLDSCGCSGCFGCLRAHAAAEVKQGRHPRCPLCLLAAPRVADAPAERGRISRRQLELLLD